MDASQFSIKTQIDRAMNSGNFFPPFLASILEISSNKKICKYSSTDWPHTFFPPSLNIPTI